MPTTYFLHALQATKQPYKVFVTSQTNNFQQYPVIGSFTVADNNTDNLGWIGNHVLYQQVQDMLYKKNLLDMQEFIIVKDTDVVVPTGFTTTTNPVSVKVGQTITIAVTPTPSNASTSFTSLASANPKVATASTIDYNNVSITGVTAGTVNINFTDGTANSAISVTVTAS